MVQKNNFNIVFLVNNSGCFDLQFRKDTRRERTNSPTYYRWKAQFVITASKEDIKKLSKVKKIIGCGSISTTKDQVRFSVQKIGDIKKTIIPFFSRNKLTDKKKKDFEMWHKAVNIIHRNKGKYIAKWEKSDLLSLIEIHKSTAKYKNKPKNPKWMAMARTMAKIS